MSKRKSADVVATLRTRQGTYGRFIDQATTSVALKAILRTTPNWSKLPPDMQEALDMDAVKTARILHGDPNYADNWHDKAGYATLIEKRLIDGDTI